MPVRALIFPPPPIWPRAINPAPPPPPHQPGLAECDAPRRVHWRRIRNGRRLTVHSARAAAPFAPMDSGARTATGLRAQCRVVICRRAPEHL